MTAMTSTRIAECFLSYWNNLFSAFCTSEYRFPVYSLECFSHDRQKKFDEVETVFFLSLTSLTSVTILSTWAGSVFYLMPKFGTHLLKSRILPIPKLSSPSIDGYADSTKQQKDLGIVHNYQQNIVNGIRPADVCSSLVWKWEAWMNNILSPVFPCW